MIPILYAAVFLKIVWAQNDNCPLCSLGYPAPPQIMQQPAIQQTIETPHTIYMPSSFNSYPNIQAPAQSLPSVQAQSEFASPSAGQTSLYNGNAQQFGQELGKAIAQRIQQIYAAAPAQQQSNTQNIQAPSSQQQYMQMPQSFSSYPSEVQSQPNVVRLQPPEPLPITFNPPHHPFTGQLMTGYPGMLPAQQEAPFRNAIEPPMQQKSCPYCFGNQGQLSKKS